ncbi:MAG: hypothetical protein E2O68_05680 [Deltaproteobacteria bacterium]|nr:MAG: hypothetical protein E2O68_05680 [Deltaproteobacteria bacterium]
MERNPTTSSDPQKRPVSLNDEFDDISFKPLTKGLGFHHQKETNRPRPFRPSPRPQTYTPPPTQTFREPVNKVKQQKILVLGSFKDRILAFLVDFGIVSLITGLTLTTLVYGANLNIQVLISILDTYEIILFASSIFSLYFLLYFSILDLSSTVGKSLMGLELKLENGKRPLLGNTFPRAVVTLISLALLGLPLLSNFQNRFSESEVFKK